MSQAFESSWKKYKVVYSPLHNKQRNRRREERKGKFSTLFREYFKLTSTERLNGILKEKSLLMLFLSVLIYLHQAEDWWCFVGMKFSFNISCLKLKEHFAEKCQNYIKIQLFAANILTQKAANCSLIWRETIVIILVLFNNIINFIERENNIYSHYFCSNIKFHINIIKS